MKLGLFLGLLLLLASINILTINGRRVSGIKSRMSQAEIDEYINNIDNEDYDHDDDDDDDGDSDEFDDRNLHYIMKNIPDEDLSDETTDRIGIIRKLIPVANVVDDESKPALIINEKVKANKLANRKGQSKFINGFGDNKEDKNKQTIEGRGRKIKGPTKIFQVSNNSIHVSGNIVLVQHHSSIVDIVQYKIDSTLTKNSSVEKQNLFSENSIISDSNIILYVSTNKTISRKLASSKYLIKIKQNSFPLSFHIHVKLPNQTHDNITLYFFVYAKNGDNYLDTFIPAGTSQINLQGTNRLSQKLDVYVKANGTALTGVFRGRFGQKYISSSTQLQVFIIPEQSLAYYRNLTFESVSQLTIKNVPSSYPVTFSLLILNHILNPNSTYYAIACTTENGTRRLINQEPIMIFNKKKVITSEVVFNVIPSPCILYVNVIRSMPGPLILQPRSSLTLRLHEIDSNSSDIVFKLNEISKLPHDFQINISQATRFNPSKNYSISLMIMDEKNSTYMSTSAPIPLHEDNFIITIPVDDLLYYVQVRLDSPSHAHLNYIPGSTARIFVTESPEMLIKPIAALRIDSIPDYFREFSFQIPVTSIQHDRDYYLVMMIDMNGIITHVTKSLLITNKQPPPLVIQLPVPSLNVISGTIYDIQHRPAQWSSSSYATLILLDDTTLDFDRAVVQTWKIRLEKDFPINFRIELDFTQLRSNHIYRLQAAIENGKGFLEYEPASSILALNPYGGIINALRIPVRMVKRFQIVEGIIYMNSIYGPLPEFSEIILQISSSRSLQKPDIIWETSLSVDGRYLPLNFTMQVPLDSIDINSVHYLLAKYVVDDTIIIPTSQAFPFLPRNEKPVVVIISNTAKITITGQVISTNSSLMLPEGSLLHLYITKSLNQTKSQIYSDVFLRASASNIYDFRMNIDFDLVQNKTPLYLHADIVYGNKIIISMPKPLLLPITSDGEWNINLVVDLPTLLIGQIVSSNEQDPIYGDFDGHIHIIDRNTTNIVHKVQLRVASNLPLNFRIELDNDLFVRYSTLQARAFIKNCKGEIIFDADDTVDIHQGINVGVELPVVLFDRKKLNAPKIAVNNNAPSDVGIWRLSVTGIATDSKSSTVTDIRKRYTAQ